MPIADSYILFCDDIRDEANGKTSFMGTFGRVIELEQPAPAVIPKICVSMIADVRHETSMLVTFSATADTASRLPPPQEFHAENETPEESDWQIKVNLVLNGLQIPAGGTVLRIQCKFGEVVKEAELVIRDKLA